MSAVLVQDPRPITERRTRRRAGDAWRARRLPRSCPSRLPAPRLLRVLWGACLLATTCAARTVVAQPAGSTCLHFAERDPPPFAEARHFTSDQLDVLERHGWCGDLTDRRVVRLLLLQGFTQPEIVRAYVDAHQARAGRARVECAARYRLLRLPDRQLAQCLSSDRSLTEWHNRIRGSGQGLRRLGWLLTGIGLVSAAIGATVIGVVQRPRQCPAGLAPDECQASSGNGGIGLTVGVPMLVGGLLELTAGVPMVIVGNARLRRRVEGDALDRGSRQELERHRAALPPGATSEPSLALQPVLSRGGAGVSFQLRW